MPDLGGAKVFFLGEDPGDGVGAPDRGRVDGEDPDVAAASAVWVDKDVGTATGSVDDGVGTGISTLRSIFAKVVYTR